MKILGKKTSSKDNIANRPWLISFCFSNRDEVNDEAELNHELNCLDRMSKLKLAIMLNKFVNVASVDCNGKVDTTELCNLLNAKPSVPIMYYYSLPEVDQPKDAAKMEPIMSADYKQIEKTVFHFLPEVKLLNEEELDQILLNLRNMDKREKPWFIEFVNGYQPNQENELKKMPILLGSNFNFARFDCQHDPNGCFFKYQIIKYPAFYLFKSATFIIGGPINYMHENWYEINYSNKQNPEDMAGFVKENAYTSVRTIKEFETGMFLDNLLQMENKIGYFIDFFAPVNFC